MFCSGCGAQLGPSAQFCHVCGRPTAPGAPAGAPGQPVWGAPAPVAARYAGFWLRFVAYLIDSLVVGVPLVLLCVLLVVLFGGFSAIHGRSPEELTAAIAGTAIAGIFLLILVGLAGTWLYFALMESSPRQATLGKAALSLRVVDLQLQRVTFGRATGRHFAKLISGLIPLGIGYIMAGFTQKKQAIHDMIASCLVIRDN